jgi:hypothetical protein
MRNGNPHSRFVSERYSPRLRFSRGILVPKAVNVIMFDNGTADSAALGWYVPERKANRVFQSPHLGVLRDGRAVGV